MDLLNVSPFMAIFQQQLMGLPRNKKSSWISQVMWSNPNWTIRGGWWFSRAPILTNAFPVFQENPVFAQFHGYERVEDTKLFKEILGAFLKIYYIWYCKRYFDLPQNNLFLVYFLGTHLPPLQNQPTSSHPPIPKRSPNCWNQSSTNGSTNTCTWLSTKQRATATLNPTGYHHETPSKPWLLQA